MMHLRKFNESVEDRDLLFDILQEIFDEYLVEKIDPEIADSIRSNGIYCFEIDMVGGLELSIFCNWGYVENNLSEPPKNTSNEYIKYEKLLRDIRDVIHRLKKIGYTIDINHRGATRWELVLLRIKFPK